MSVYLSVNYRCFSTWSHVNNAATAKSHESLLVMVIGHLRETFYFIYGCGRRCDGLAWGSQRTNPWILCSPGFTWMLGIEFGLQGVLSNLTGPERNSLKEKGLDSTCRPWLAVYTVSRPLVRQNMVVDGCGSKAAYLMVARNQKKEDKVPIYRYTSNPLLPTRTPPIHESSSIIHHHHLAPLGRTVPSTYKPFGSVLYTQNII